MKLHIISVRDIVADVYGQPIFAPSLGGAIRSFGDAINNQDKTDNLAKHPEHFEFWLLGEYDDETGTITAYDTGQRKQLAAGANLVITKQ